MLNLIHKSITDKLADRTPFSQVYKTYLLSLQDDLINSELHRLSAFVHPTQKTISKSLQVEFEKLQKLAGE